MTIRNLPKLAPGSSEMEILNWANSLVDALELTQKRLSQAAETGYSVTNKTVTRSLDCDNATLAESADVLGTLIDDLKGTGRIG